MIEVIVIGILLVFMSVQEYFNRQERKRLMDAFMAKNLEELKQAERIEKLPISQPFEEPERPPDLMEMDNVSEEEFDLAIKKELGREPLLEKAKERLKRTFK